MIKKLTFALLVWSCLTQLYSQYEGNRWYFTASSNRGLFFDLVTNIPSVTGEHVTPYNSDGSGVATNPFTGSLMFYNTGDRVYDNTHQIMPNGSGLTSWPSSDLTGAVWQKPDNCNQFYIFHNTAAAEVGNGIFRYSVVDMSLPGNGSIINPLGDVVAGQKNIVLKNNTAEAFCLIKSTQTSVSWLIVVSYDAAEFNIFKIDSTGINPFGTYNYPFTNTSFRAIDYSYQSGKICVVSSVENEPTALLDFDRTLGIITASAIIPGTPVGSGPNYWEGMMNSEWSADGTKLYISKFRVPSGVTGGKIYQYDLNFPANPATVVCTMPGGYNNFIAGIKRGPDGKIYFMHNHPTYAYRYLGVINNPNIAGAGCGVTILGIDLGIDVGMWGVFSEHLPRNFKPIAMNDSLDASCSNYSFDSISVLLNDYDFDDDMFDINFFNIPSEATLTINTNQTVNVDLQNATGTVSIPYQICDLNCFSRCDTGYIVISIPPSIALDFLVSDTVVCNGDTINLTATLPGDSYLWEIGDTTSSIQVDQSGVYILEMTVAGCPYTDSTIVFEETSPIIDIGPDTLLCDEEFIILNASYPASDYLWSTGSITSQIPVNVSGTYSVEVSNLCGTFVDSINLTFNTTPVIELGPDTIICPEDTLTFTLTAFWPSSSILWSTGETTPVINVTQSATYAVTISNECGTVTDSVRVLILKGCAGIEDLNSSVQLYPNPASDYIYITTPHQNLHLLNANLISIDGKNITLNNASQTSQGYYFNFGEMASGIYMLSLTFEEGKANKKVIISR